MKKILIGTVMSVVVSLYIFSTAFNFLPHNLNTKMILAVVGVVSFLLKGFRGHGLSFSRRTFIAALFSIVFSVWCLYCVTVNNSSETVYITYWSSFATWLAGAYGVYIILKTAHERVDLRLITKYLAIVSVAQCVIALMIDNIPAVEALVKAVFFQSYDFYERVDRLYGIGCALDPAGVRFGCILLLIAHQIAVNPDVTGSKSALAKYISAFILITIGGSMIARTTSVGALIALGYILLRHLQIQRGGNVSIRHIRTFAVLTLILVVIVGAAVILYRTNVSAYRYLRFAFEGFFNWVETGEFQTTSTDILKNMWIWPTTTHDWIIGTGHIGVYYWNSDIGYCNFVLYCGLIGMVIYACYYIYCSLSLNSKFKDFWMLSLLLLVFQGAVWAKVTTDIFFILALLFCIDGDDLEDATEETESQ